MKLQFEPNQQYQLDAIKAAVDVFTGQPKESDPILFPGQAALEFEGQQLTLETVSARGNVLALSPTQVAQNTHAIQQLNAITKSELAGAGLSVPTVTPAVAEYGVLKDGLNFSVEMETGTGKTYVYLRTIHELHQEYGWKKFMIVVPSVAIREGVLKNLEITREHFADLYNKPEMNYYVWDSKKIGMAREFATNDTLQIMVITIDSFAKAENVMNKISEYGKPLDFIRATNPIVIIDEPQNMETDIRREAIANLNPMCTLRYSATHKHPYNMLYRLTPVDAYDKGLVKKIEVHSVVSEDSYNDVYIAVIKIERNGKNRLLAQLELDISSDHGLLRKTVKIAPGDDLARVTKRTLYEAYVVESISFTDQSVEFSNGKILYVGQHDEGLHEEIIKRQIEVTIEDHFEKQARLNDQGVKVLSLFFIDKVANYREYADGGYTKGKFATWFEEAYEHVSQKPRYIDVLKSLSANEVHDGYFAKDKSGHWKDSRDNKGEGGKTKEDDVAYNLIMKEKERLLDMSTPLRFIFSHSALREGWDNPNVFNICTLNETTSEMKKRQEIGRGLRLPVNDRGERVRDDSVNILTVIANESYADFSRKLQTEIEDETGITFGSRIKNRDDRKPVKFQKNIALDPAFKDLWERIRHKTTYRVNIDVQKLIDRSVAQLGNVTISRPQLSSVRTTIESMGDGEFKARETIDASRMTHAAIGRIPDVISAIQARTYLTRPVIFDMLDKSSMFDNVPTNPQQVIDEVAVIANRVKRELAVDGIKYEKTGESYDMLLFENRELETYLYDAGIKSGAIEVQEQHKTVYDYIAVDSGVEYNFMKALEGDDNVQFYIKLPGWFAIDTPVGSYNPDWAVVFNGDERVYFVAETKDTDDLNDEKLRNGEREKIIAGREHFKAIDVSYIAPVRTWSDAVKKLSRTRDTA